MISLEMGAPIDLAANDHVGAGAFHIENFITAFRDFRFERPLGAHAPDDRILMEPIGVAGLITPWNWPMNQVALKVVPALLAGCTAVLKPSEIAPLSSLLFAEYVDEAGFPNGVFNLVNGDGARAGARLSSHPDVDMISFTGSTRAGIAISIAAAADPQARIARTRRQRRKSRLRGCGCRRGEARRAPLLQEHGTKLQRADAHAGRALDLRARGRGSARDRGKRGRRRGASAGQAHGPARVRGAVHEESRR